MFVSDIAMVVGVACLTVSGYFLHPAAAWGIPGCALIVFAIGVTRGNKKK